MTNTPDILKKIIKRKEQEIDTRVKLKPIEQIIELIKDTSPVRGFVDSMKARLANDEPAVIAEIKQASPSKGLICEEFIPAVVHLSHRWVYSFYKLLVIAIKLAITV